MQIFELKELDEPTAEEPAAEETTVYEPVSFDESVPRSFNLTAGTLWSYQYPSVSADSLTPY